MNSSSLCAVSNVAAADCCNVVCKSSGEVVCVCVSMFPAG